MTVGFHRALGAAAVAALLAGASGAQAQANRPWVDPPTGNTKADAPAPAQPAQEATQRPAPAQAPTVASKPTPLQEPVIARPEKKRLARTKSKPVVEARQAEERRVEEKRTVETSRSAARRTVASDQPRRDRVIREAGSEPLEVMSLRTIEFPDGRRVQVLMKPDPETVSELLRR